MKNPKSFLNEDTWRRTKPDRHYFDRKYYRDTGRMTLSGKMVRDEPDAKRIRMKYRMTQKELAWLMNISVHTLRNWEQGRRKPRGPSKILLRLVDLYPESIHDLRSAKNSPR